MIRPTFYVVSNNEKTSQASAQKLTVLHIMRLAIIIFQVKKFFTASNVFKLANGTFWWLPGSRQITGCAPAQSKSRISINQALTCFLLRRTRYRAIHSCSRLRSTRCNLANTCSCHTKTCSLPRRTRHEWTNSRQTAGGFAAVLSTRCIISGVGRVCVLRCFNEFDVVN